MKREIRSMSSKLVGLAAAFALMFTMACATTTEPDGIQQSNEVAAGETVDPLGPPQHIESEITREHPSSNTGAGNAQASGANTNLNTPQPEPTTTVVESDAEVVQTPIVEEETIIVETEPVKTVQVDTTMEEDEEEVVVRRVTKKE